VRSRRMAMFCCQLKSLNPSSGPNPDQFENLANMRAHERGTGAEIWRQTGGEIDAFVMSAGSAAGGRWPLGIPLPSLQRHSSPHRPPLA
jgi:cysteine synthase